MNVMDIVLVWIKSRILILFIYWSFTMKFCVWMTNEVVERTFKMHIAVLKKRCNTWIAEIHFNIDLTHSLFNTIIIILQAHLR